MKLSFLIGSVIAIAAYLIGFILEAFKDTVDFNGETLEELNEEIFNVVESNFGSFIPEASFKIK